MTSAVSKKEKIALLLQKKESELHEAVEELVRRMFPDATVEITHGNSEYGKDIVSIHKEEFGCKCRAYVVKKGDKNSGKITGRTRGPIDEIISQVRQALEHPYRRPNGEEIKVNEVVVLIFGYPSKNARERLSKEIEFPNVFINDLGQIIELFDKYYPEYLQFPFWKGVIEEYMKELVNSKEVFLSDTLKSEELFIEPYALVKDITEIDRSVYTLDIPEIIEKRKDFSQLKTLVLTDRRNVLLVGEAGVGKTLSMKKLVLDVLRESYFRFRKSGEGRIKVPLFIRAIDLVDDSIERKFSDILSLDNCDIPFIVVDGIDEVKEMERQRILDEVLAFSENFGAKLIITSRTSAIRSLIGQIPDPGKFLKVELLPFDLNQAIKLAKKLISDGELLSRIEEGIEKLLESSTSITPLQILLLARIAKTQREIPLTISTIMEEYFRVIFEEIPSQKEIENILSSQVRLPLIEELAFKIFFLKDRLEVPLREFKEFVSGFIESKLPTIRNSVTPERVLQELERYEVINLNEKGKVSFKHRSFLDFFIAKYIQRITSEEPELFLNHFRRFRVSSVKEFLIQFYFDVVWHEVVLFHAGLKRTISTDVIDGIFSFRKKDGISTSYQPVSTDFEISAQKALVGRLLQAAFLSDKSLKVESVRRILDKFVVVREDLIQLMRDKNLDVPTLFIDFLILILVETSLSSFVLEDSIREIQEEFFDQLSENSDFAIIYKFILVVYALLKVCKRRKEAELYKSLMKDVMKFLEDMKKSKNLTVEDKYKLLLLLRFILEGNVVDEKEVKIVKKEIRSIMKKLGGRYSEVVQSLLDKIRNYVMKQS